MWIDDSILERSRMPVVHEVWRPDGPMVVLGSSNASYSECDVDACGRDGVPILRRYGGGGTVLLYPGCIIVSAGVWVKQHFQNNFYFKLCNQAVIEALTLGSSKFNALSQAGISDIVWKADDETTKKVAGTSLFRSRNYLLYQASIIVDIDSEMIAKYLKHPTKEPDYRAGRPHADFLTGLSAIDSSSNVEKMMAALRNYLGPAIEKNFGGELIAPCGEQFSALDARLTRASET